MFSAELKTNHKIETPAHMAEVVAEVARVDAHVATAKAAETETKRRAADELAADLVAKVGKTTMAVEEYRDKLVQRAKKAAEENPELAAADGKKSRNYPAGSVGFKKTRDCVVLVDAKKRDSLAAKIGKKIQTALRSFLPWPSVKAANGAAIVKSVKVEKDQTLKVDLDPAKLANIDAATLKRAGYGIQKGGDVFDIWPNKTNVD